MNENKLGTIHYYIKVTAQGGETYVTQQKTFEIYCGPESAGLTETPFDNYILSDLHPVDNPSFTIEGFTTRSKLCLVQSYQLYSLNNRVHNKFQNQAYGVVNADNTVKFTTT